MSNRRVERYPANLIYVTAVPAEQTNEKVAFLSVLGENAGIDVTGDFEHFAQIVASEVHKLTGTWPIEPAPPFTPLPEDLKATGDWVEADNGQVWSTTNDGRVIAVIQREDEPSAPWGDGLAPISYVEYGRNWNVTRHGETFEDDTVLAAHANALKHWGHDERVERFLKIFYDTTILEVEDRDGFFTIYNTPAFREHSGMTDLTADAVSGERDEVDGDVWGVGWGYYTGEDDTSGATPVGDDFDLFDVTIECWGFYGIDYAKESAAAFEHVGIETITNALKEVNR